MFVTSFILFGGGGTYPTLIGFLSLLFIGIAIFFIIETLKLKNKIAKIVLSGILVTNYSISLLNASYLHDADSYGLALLLISIGLWLIVNDKKQIYWLGIIFFTLSLGIYQAYANVVLFIFLMIAFVELLSGNNWKESIINLIKRGFLLGFAMILYYVGYLLVVKLTNVNQLHYNSPTVVLNFDFDFICKRIFNTIWSEIDWFFWPSNYNVKLIECLNILMVVLAVIFIVAIALKKRSSKMNYLWMFLILVAMPIGINFITFISSIYHGLTYYAFFLTYAFVLVLSENYAELYDDAILKKLPIIFMAIMIFDNCIYSNAAYLKKELEHEATLFNFTRIVDRVEQLEGYVPGETEILFIGELNDSQITNNRIGFDYNGVGLWDNYSVTYYETYEVYLNYYLGYKANIGPYERASEYTKRDDVKQMDYFPSKDSIKMIDDVVIIKLSDFD